jgi:anti-sigma factor RsiW
MNNHEAELKVQAYLDGELTAREAAEVEARLAKDADGAALLAELRNTKTALTGSETPLMLPESREFFWSKVQREIERQEKAVAVAPKISWLAWVRHHLVSVGGAALLTCFVGMMVLRGAGGGPLGEMDIAADDMGAYTYRDQQAKMTVVWFYNKSDDSEYSEPAAIASMDPE